MTVFAVLVKEVVVEAAVALHEQVKRKLVANGWEATIKQRVLLQERRQRNEISITVREKGRDLLMEDEIFRCSGGGGKGEVL